MATIYTVTQEVMILNVESSKGHFTIPLTADHVMNKGAALAALANVLLARSEQKHDTKANVMKHLHIIDGLVIDDVKQGDVITISHAK